tara:strand:+ start:230 stop:667 length:438 start_codon:yes stop_codon:yes gene_type:complete
MIETKGVNVVERLKDYQALKYNKNNKFDVDLEFGEKFEKSVAKILTLGKVEIKTERDKWKKTGNIAIELSSRGKLSGLNTTKADWWCQVLTLEGDIVGIYMWPIDLLKIIVKHSVKYGRGRMTMGGDNDTSELALVPLEDLTNGF